jgi:3-dehydroquinate synthase
MFYLQHLKIKHFDYFCTMSYPTSLLTDMSRIFFEESGWEELADALNKSDYSNVFVLTDKHTNRFCLPILESKIKQPYTVLVMEAGEKNKHLQSCSQLWRELSELGADRNALLINLGGGVVTDLGGFVACAYKRGIDFINIPTTLLSMVDASVGGKTGVDLDQLKNQIGIIQEPSFVLVDPVFLKTLPENEFRSGYAEMLKHGLIQDRDYFERLSTYSYDIEHIGKSIYHSICIKSNVVSQDPTEKNLRKILNFGHTLGHAIESYFLDHSKHERLLHGEAIAIGMVMEAQLSYNSSGLSAEERNRIKEVFKSIYPEVHLESGDIKSIKDLLRHDKKNRSGKIRFALLESIGKPVIDQVVSEEAIDNAIAYYLS